MQVERVEVRADQAAERVEDHGAEVQLLIQRVLNPQNIELNWEVAQRTPRDAQRKAEPRTAHALTPTTQRPIDPVSEKTARRPADRFPSAAARGAASPEEGGDADYEHGAGEEVLGEVPADSVRVKQQKQSEVRERVVGLQESV